MRYAMLLDGQKVVPLFMVAGETAINMYSNGNEAFSVFSQNKSTIMKVLLDEVGRFAKTLNTGLKEINKIEELNAKNAFSLYETFGYPFELTEEIARERGQKVEYGEFRKEFEKHQEISRAGAEKKFGGHGLLMDTGELKAGNEEELKKATRLHTATHLLHASLRKILGTEVHQAGSDITAERLRFDFTFSRKMTPEEIKQVEDLVNEAVQKDYTVTKEEMSYEDAIKSGAMAFFKLKYPPMVNVYSVGDFSKELCGGPHVSHSAEIGKFKIIKEEAVSAGVRRIRATVDPVVDF
jgi:alanyl-tRNA synthetase